MNLAKFRKVQVIASTLTFCLVFVYFFLTSPRVFTDIQLSFWGVHSSHSWLWNSIVSVLAISMFINVHHYLWSFEKLKMRKHLIRLFGIVSIALFLTGAFNANFFIVHNASAFFYFFMCPLAIFLISHFNSKNMSYAAWKNHILFSVAILCIPISLLFFFKGMAISESVHSFLILLWNYYILNENSK